MTEKEVTMNKSEMVEARQQAKYALNDVQAKSKDIDTSILGCKHKAKDVKKAYAKHEKVSRNYDRFGHLPIIGNRIENNMDVAYAKLMTDSRTIIFFRE